MRIDATHNMRLSAKKADMIQDACNLSGVLKEFEVQRDAVIAEFGVGALRDHPIIIAFADKVSHLTGIQSVGSDRAIAAHTAVAMLLEGKDIEWNPDAADRRDMVREAEGEPA